MPPNPLAPGQPAAAPSPNARLQQSYDRVPYDSLPFAETHVGVLATAARLAGMTPAPLARCSVLEIGCASGGNLLPMAQAFPESTFVGIDLSPKQIADGQRLVTGAQLKNVRLEAKDVSTIEPGFGTFDYVICHGVYSWVPPAVREKILAVLAANLAPQGVAFVSYNTYPGWHLRGMVRDIFRHHVRGMPDPIAAVGECRRLLGFLDEFGASGDQSSRLAAGNVYAMALHRETAFLNAHTDAQVMHDQLELYNEPVLFAQFAEQLAGRKLAYLGEATPGLAQRKAESDLRERYPEIAADRLKLEQYTDFLYGTQTRRSLVIRDGAAPNLGGPPDPAVVEGLAARARLAAVGERIDLAPGVGVPFRAPDGVTVTLDEPMTKAVLVAAGRAWPAALPVETLLTQVREMLGQGPAFAARGTQERTVMSRVMLFCHGAGLLELNAHAPRFAAEPGERPRATMLARVQARDGAIVTNLLHYRVNDLTRFDRVALALLSGNRDRAGLAEAVRGAVAKGVLPDPQQAGPAAMEAGFLGTVENSLEMSLRKFANTALLVA